MAPLFPKIEKKLKVFLGENGLNTRPGASSGVFLSLLLPTAYLISRIKLETWSISDLMYISISLNFLLHSLLNIYYLNDVNSKYFSKKTLLLCTSISFVLLFPIVEVKFLFLMFVPVILFEYMVIVILKCCPKSFSFGECCVVSHGVIFFFTSFFVREPNSSDCIKIASSILQVGIINLLFIAIFSFSVNVSSKPILFYAFTGASLSVGVVSGLMYFESINPYVWIFDLIQSEWVLVLYWFGCSVLSVIFIVYQVKKSCKADTVMRKSFHVLTVIVYVPGLILSPCFLYLASGIAFAILIGVDLVRVLKIPPLSTVLQNGFAAFSDEKDSGFFALTPIYLIVGCSLPLWIHPRLNDPNALLPLLSGVITVGIGDSAASLCGSLLGRNRWPRSKKTKEGSAGCFLSQLFFIITLIHFGYIPRKDLIRPFLAVSVTSLVEAKTDQVDNLILPLLMFIFVT